MVGTSAKQWNIRIANLDDAKGICEMLFMLKTMYGSTPAKSLQDFLPIHLPVIRRALESTNNIILVAHELDGLLVGFISLTIRTVLRVPHPIGSIEEIFIRKEYRRKSVGTALWEEAAKLLNKGGVTRIEVISSLAHPGQRPFAKSIGMEWYSSVHTIDI